MHVERRERGQGGTAPAAWRHMGSVDFASPGFHEELAQLRAMATGAGPEVALPVTLIIPDDQILYTTLTVAPGADREHAVGRALDGLTPYAIEDLAFDWEGDGDSVRVAAVARQTLREARDFAEQYGFDGQAYCASPVAGVYPGEPVFSLRPASRVRTQVDPAQAAVTASALLIEEEDPEDAAEQEALDLDADRPEATEGEAVDSFSDADAGQAEPPSEESAPAEAGEAEEPKENTGPISAPEVAVENIEDIGADPENSEEILDKTVGEALAEETPQDEGAAVSEGAFEDPAETLAAEAAGIPTEAAAAMGGAALAAGPKSAPRASNELNPRARALHERAASARQTRPAGSAPPQQPKRAGQRGGLAGLVTMLGALVVGLILIWAFLVPNREPAQIAAVVPTVAPVEQAAVPHPAEPAPAQTAIPDVAAPAEPMSAPAIAEPVQSTDPATDPATDPVAAEPAAIEPQQPAAVNPAATATPPVSALTEEEQRRVIVAAAAVAAAVVPPVQATVATEPQPQQQAQETSPPPAAETPQPAAVPRPATVAAPAPAPAQARPAAPAPAATRLTSSARPQLAPRRSTPQTTVPRADTAPRLPSDPLPFEASQRRADPVASARPPARSRPAAPVVAPTVVPAQAQAQVQSATTTSNAVMRGSARPPSRPEGSTPELSGADLSVDSLTPAEQQHLRDLIGDIGRSGLVSLDPMPRGERLAQARPQRKPGASPPATASDVVSPSAIDAALSSATTPPPDKPARTETAAAPAQDLGGLLRGSSRPRARPGTAAAAAVSGEAVEAALSAAVAASPASPGGVQLSALASSPLPPRRGDRPAASPEAAANPAPAEAAAAAAAPGVGEAELDARRKLDEQLQAQAEARIRARAAADAKAEAQARAQAEARARAQADAEERAARAKSQEYKPPEIDNEPEIAASALTGGATSASVAKSATQARAIDLGRTTVIGIIGAGKASRALIRLRNGKVVTVRLGDRIDGGTINSIGDGRLTYVKAGRTHELRMLDGR